MSSFYFVQPSVSPSISPNRILAPTPIRGPLSTPIPIPSKVIKEEPTSPLSPGSPKEVTNLQEEVKQLRETVNQLKQENSNLITACEHGMQGTYYWWLTSLIVP